MRSGDGDLGSSNSSRRIIGAALLVGGVGFIGGFFGPAFVSSSNLGPLLGIFVTGPLGALAGALWAVVRSAEAVNAPEPPTIIGWLAAIWVVTSLYMLFMTGVATHAALPAIVLQGIIVGAGAFLLYRGRARGRLSERVRRWSPVAIATLALMTFMAVFPPVTRPWWGPQSTRDRVDTTMSLPTVAFILDRRFDASRRVPLFAVDRRMLVLEWLVVAVGALAVGRLTMRQRGRPNLEV